jgi:uncharacterized protein YeaO (DUF488 family)
MIKIKRVYEKPDKGDGFRVLVDRLWPRGLSKEKADIDRWLKDIAPSNELREWFAHKAERWEEFRIRYLKQLENKQQMLKDLQELSEEHTVTLLYAAKNRERNNAQVLLEFLNK